jgi:hypothetical protein
LGKVGHDDPLGQMEPVQWHSTPCYDQTLPTSFVSIFGSSSSLREINK